jgi:hypothetical protein
MYDRKEDFYEKLVLKYLVSETIYIIELFIKF